MTNTTVPAYRIDQVARGLDRWRRQVRTAPVTVPADHYERLLNVVNCALRYVQNPEGMDELRQALAALAGD